MNVEPLPPPPPPPVPEGPYPEKFEVLGLSPAVLAAIRETGYETPTTIQERAIPVVLQGRDVVGASQTGTGKTAAFALPTLSRLGAPGTFRCLVLEPTRELAAQVVDQFEKYGKHTGLRVLLVHGGVGYEKQRRGLQQGVDVVVATPGRLLDFMKDGTANLENIDVLILDDWGMGAIDSATRSDLLEIIDDRAANRATIITSQLPVEHWHAWIGDATIADAILDRLLQRTHRLTLTGDSLRDPKHAKTSKKEKIIDPS